MTTSDCSADRPNLYGMSRSQLVEFLRTFDDRPFRAKQLMKWIYHERVEDFGAMTNLSKVFRAQLVERLRTELPDVIHQSTSNDGTTKWLIETFDGGAVESVLIPDSRRNTLCISSQRGCSLDCAFCATGKQGFAGNLTIEDVVGQVVLASDWLQMDPSRGELTNVVFMGMGEPLMNFDVAMTAADLFMDDLAFGISKRRVTISTAGVVPKIYDMCGRTEASLAVSLHAPNDELRDTLVPLNRKYPIRDLLTACQAYLDSLSDRRIVTFEYTLIDGVNDSDDTARELAQLLRDFRCKLNLIPFNPIPGADFRRPTHESTVRFQRLLMDNGLMVTLRTTRGQSINAACGQLVGQFQDKTRRRTRYVEVQGLEAM